ncbi:MAG: GDSL-type esterase/lipase family protein [Capsulimonas sp.]|uniref:SGNH/GDSL hydrolase family protein n=1 Tax=Capsulimonas sp. TaxID=2494211 RepID=UPI003265769B
MTRVVFYGSSTVEGAGASTPARRFTTIVSKAMGWEEVNLGIGGTTVVGRDEEGQLIRRDSGLGRVPDVIDANPDLALILYGANDFGGSLELGSERERIWGTFYWDYDSMLRGILGGVAPEKVVLSTCQYRADADTPNESGYILQDYNGAIKKLGAQYGVRVLDPFQDSTIDSRNFDKLCADPTHLNDNGYEQLAAFFLEALR